MSANSEVLSAAPRRSASLLEPCASGMHETFTEFTFEAAHQTPPHSGLHGHSFRVRVYLKGPADPVFGWSHNLYDVEEIVRDLKMIVDHKYLNDVPGLEIPSLENLTKWIWHQLEARIEGVDRVLVRRGFEGSVEGCVYGRTSA